jgi:hypothetical protein
MEKGVYFKIKFHLDRASAGPIMRLRYMNELIEWNAITILKNAKRFLIRKTQKKQFSKKKNFRHF